MAIKNTIDREIPPTHPGEIIREDFMQDYNLTAKTLSEALGVSRQTINELIREKRSLSPLMALRLSRLFKNSPQFWLNVQNARDLWESEQQYQKELKKIRPFNAA